MYFRGGASHAGGFAHRSRWLGLGDRDVYALLLPVRDSHGRAGRSDRSAPRADAGGAVVVRLHFADRHGLELLPSSDDEIRLRRWRSGRVSERIDRRLTLVPSDPTRKHFRAHADGEPNWRSHRTVAGRTHPDPLWMARILLCVRRGRDGLGRRLVHLVPRFSRRETGSEPGGAHRDRGSPSRIGAGFPMADRVGFRKRMEQSPSSRRGSSACAWISGGSMRGRWLG